MAGAFVARLNVTVCGAFSEHGATMCAVSAGAPSPEAFYDLGDRMFTDARVPGVKPSGSSGDSGASCVFGGLRSVIISVW